MTRFRFLGFPTGTAVAMSLTNGPRTETVNVSEWRMTGSVEISVLAEQSVASAPFQINLEAMVDGLGVAAPASPAEYDPQFHDIEYIWSVEKVGDASYATSTYSAVPELPDFMKVKGTKYGKRICHVIGKGDVTSGTPATFRFTVTAINLDTGASSTSSALERIVWHPDDAFAPAETFIVRASTSTSHPASIRPYYPNMGAAVSAANALPIARARICVEKGNDWPRLEGFGTSSSTIKGWLVDTWGTGEATVGANNAGAFFLFAAADACESIQFDGFRIAYSTGGARGFSARGNLTQPEDMCVTVSDFFLDGVTIGGERVSGVSRGWTAFNNYRHSEYDYCGSLDVLDENAKGLSYIGSIVADDPAGNSDNVKPDNSGAGGGGWALRISTPPHFYISNCHFFTKQGWFVNVAGISTTQPNWRLTVRDGARCQFSQCLMEGSGQTILRMSNEEGGAGVANALVHRCFFTSAYGLQQFMETNVAATIRNNVFVMGPGRSPTVYPELERISTNGGSDTTNPLKFYNNTLINLQEGSTAAVGVLSGDRTLIDANNVMHQPYKDIPASAGSFSLLEIYDTKQDGYSTVAVGQDPVYVCRASVTVPFTPGEIVTGSVSGISKTYVGTRDRFRNEGMLAFEMPLVYDNLAAAGIDRFASNDVLAGSLGGAATMGSMYSSQTHDTAMFATGNIPDTIMPTHVIVFASQTGNFKGGETLTGEISSATGTICQVFDDGTTGLIWLRDITGTFVDNEAITDGLGGSARADGEVRSAGTGALWIPAEGNPALGAALNDPVALTDFFGNRRPAYPSKGAFEAGF